LRYDRGWTEHQPMPQFRFMFRHPVRRSIAVTRS